MLARETCGVNMLYKLKESRALVDLLCRRRPIVLWPHLCKSQWLGIAIVCGYHIARQEKEARVVLAIE